MMHQHARLIYKAALDGKTVQIKTEEGWKDDNPFRCPWHPIDFPLSWRIKPETKMEGIWYRVYVDISSGNEVPRIAWTRDKEDLQYLNKKLERRIGFIGWITEWIYFVSEVEE